MLTRLSNIKLSKSLWPQGLLLVAAVLLLAGRVVQMDGPDVVMDDAFISFRYAVNLAQGAGVVFNPGERVEGYTNFLWTALLAVCHRLGGNVVLSAKIGALLAAMGTLVVLYLFGQRLFAGRKGHLFLIATPVLLFATLGSQARYVVSGMETLLFVFLVTLSLYLYFYSEHPFLTGLAFALTAMTRPEGLLYFALACGYRLIVPQRGERHQAAARQVMWLLTGFLVLYGAYFVWRYRYYGYLLPNTFYAKAAGLYWGRLERGWAILCQLIGWWNLQLLLAVSVLALFSWRENQAWLLFAALVAATLAYFVFVGGDFIVWFGPRFLMPIMPALLLMCAEGLRWLTRPRLLPQAIKSAGPVVLLAALLINAGWFSWPARYFSAEVFAVQMRGWAEMGRWIANHTPPDATLATDAAGLIPFYAGRYTIDMFGLTDLHIAHLDMPVTAQSIAAHEKFDPDYILARQPDYIVSTWMDPQGQAVSAGLNSVAEAFNRSYRLIAVAKIKNGPPDDGRWILETSTYTPELHQQGYLSGLFGCQTCP